MTDNSEALLPCPFGCGRGEPILSSWMLGTARELLTAKDQWEHAVRCNCGAQGPEGSNAAEAIAAWNTRPSSPAASDGDLEDEVAVFLRAYGDAFVREVLKQAAPVSDGGAVREAIVRDQANMLREMASRRRAATGSNGQEPQDLDMIARTLDDYAAVLASSPALSTDVAGLVNLIELRAKAADGPWFVAGRATDDGLAVIEDGRSDGMFPIKAEWHEADFIIALVNWFDANVDRLNQPSPPPTGGEPHAETAPGLISRQAALEAARRVIGASAALPADVRATVQSHLGAVVRDLWRLPDATPTGSEL